MSISKSWHQVCLYNRQGKGSGSTGRPKENAAPTDTRDKVGSPDPGKEIFGLCLLAKAQSKEARKGFWCMTDSSDAEKRFLYPTLFRWGFFCLQGRRYVAGGKDAGSDALQRPVVQSTTDLCSPDGDRRGRQGRRERCLSY